MRIVDLVFAFPAIILALSSPPARPSLVNAVIALVVVSWPTYARIVRGLVLSLETPTSYRLRVCSERPLHERWCAMFYERRRPHRRVRDTRLRQRDPALSALSFSALAHRLRLPNGSMVSEGTQYFQQWWIGTFQAWRSSACAGPQLPRRQRTRCPRSTQHLDARTRTRVSTLLEVEGSRSAWPPPRAT